jgi:hypothetical protein
MRVSGQHHALAALYPRGMDPGTHCTEGWVGPRAGLDTARLSCIYIYSASILFVHEEAGTWARLHHLQSGESRTVSKQNASSVHKYERRVDYAVIDVFVL